MSDAQKKQNFLQGTALLAMATAIVKVIGALYKIPLNAIIGEQGFGYFNTAYEIYNVLLMISTAGLPVAMSRMISQASSLEHYGQVRRIYATARTLFMTIGLVCSVLMTFFCRQLAEFQHQPDAWAAIGALGPCVLLICIMSTFRGFFQGQGNMIPTSISQVLEAVVKLLAGMLTALALLKLTNSIPLAAGGAILGVTISCIVSSLFLLGRFRKAYQVLPVTDDQPLPFWTTAKKLLKIAVPITIGSAGLSFLIMIETNVFMGQLLGLGYSQEKADTLKGIFDMTKTIYNMPCAFITPITVSIIPAITEHLTRKDYKLAKATGDSAVRVTGLICMPCAVGLFVLAKPVTALLGGYRGENLELAGILMGMLGICVIFNAMVLLTNAIMQASGHENLPVINTFIGGILRLIAVYFLTGNPNINIVGTTIGSLLCYITIMVLNLVTMARVVPNPPAVMRNLLRPLLAAIVMGVFTYGAWRGLVYLLGEDASSVILCGGPIMMGVAVYAVAAIALKAITREDCLLLPKGEKIARLLHL